MASSNRTVRTNNHPLGFRLRPSARYHRLPNGKALLVLHFPLRAVFIHASWHAVLACLGHDGWVPLERISAAAPHIPAEQIERFFNTLIQKGYLAQQGFALLNEADYPSVSVIIPVRNRPAEIAACLSSLMHLDYPADKLEIIVVDDASDDATCEAVARFPEVRLLRMQQHRQASYCRNRAAEAAQRRYPGIHRFGLPGRSQLAQGVGARVSGSFTGCSGRLGRRRLGRKRVGLL